MGKIKDLTGQKFGYLTVLNPTRINGRFGWHCQCECGNTKDVLTSNLTRGFVQSCGCKTKELIGQKVSKNLVGKTFNELTVLEKTDERQCGAIVWLCKCSCGNLTKVPTGNLTSGHTKSCGCKNYDGSKVRLKLKEGERFGLLTIISFNRVENQETIWNCLCDCGRKCEAVGWHLTTGLKQSCGCLCSKGELKIMELLEDYGIPFIREYSPEDCKFHDSNRKARFDFFVNNEYIIEFDGEQHFLNEPNQLYSKERLEQIKKHDEFKNNWCKEHSIPIIHIKYTKLKDLTIDDLILNKE